MVQGNVIVAELVKIVADAPPVYVTDANYT
jgi:hypothetical protein